MVTQGAGQQEQRLKTRKSTHTNNKSTRAFIYQSTESQLINCSHLFACISLMFCPLAYLLDTSSSLFIRWRVLNYSTNASATLFRPASIFDTRLSYNVSSDSYQSVYVMYGGQKVSASQFTAWQDVYTLNSKRTVWKTYTSNMNDMHSYNGGSIQNVSFPPVDWQLLDVDSGSVIPPARAFSLACWLWTSTLPTTAYYPHTRVPQPQDILFVFGGTENNLVDNNDAYILDFRSNTPIWSAVNTTGDVPQPVSGHRGCVIKGGRIHMDHNIMRMRIRHAVHVMY